MTFTPTFVPSPTLTPTPTITATATHTGTPFVPPTQPTITPIQVRVADAEQLDMEALIGQQVDLFIAVGEEDTPVVVPVARGVTVQEFVEVPMPNETRYVFIDAIILPTTADQAALLAGLSQTHIPMKMVPTG
jgi:hypothetical protein